MPQEMQILRCYSCETFQVHIVKKISKWECKMCGEKQSVKKVYGKGCGKDCRLYVQQFNQQRLQADEQLNLNQNHTKNSSSNVITHADAVGMDRATNSTNRWAEFMTTDDNSSNIKKISPNYGEKPIEDSKNSQFSNWELNNDDLQPVLHQVKNEPLNSLSINDSGSEFNKDTKTSRWAEFITTDTNVKSENYEEPSHNIERCRKKPRYTQEALTDEEKLYSNEDNLNIVSSDAISENICASAAKTESLSPSERLLEQYTRNINVEILCPNSKASNTSNNASSASKKTNRWTEFLTADDENVHEYEVLNDTFESSQNKLQHIKHSIVRNTQNKFMNCSQDTKITSPCKPKFEAKYKENVPTNTDMAYGYSQTGPNYSDTHTTPKNYLYESEENDLDSIFSF